MRYIFVIIAAFLFSVAACSGEASAQQIERGKLKSIDVAKKVLVVTVDGKDRELSFSEETRVLDARGNTLAEKLVDFKPGADMQFVSEKRDGREAARALRLGAGDQPRTPATPGRRVSPDHVSFKPLTEMGTTQYKGFSGGLYPDQKNERPTAHEAAGKKLAESIRPLNADGQPDTNGKIVLLSLGMSNASQVSDGFREQLRNARGLNPRFQFVNGSQGGMVAEVTLNPEEGRGKQFWDTVDERLRQAGVTRAQVQAVWIKQADGGPTQGFPGYAQKLQRELTRIVQLVSQRFPNAKLCYLSSRTYGGFATTGLNPEPVAYESGFSVKWLIEEQLKGSPELNFDAAKGTVKAPWLSWGPYLWANGETKRADGFSYEPGDFVADGTHHSPAGMRKTGELMLKFFQNDSTTKPWVMAP